MKIQERPIFAPGNSPAAALLRTVAGSHLSHAAAWGMSNVFMRLASSHIKAPESRSHNSVICGNPEFARHLTESSSANTYAQMIRCNTPLREFPAHYAARIQAF